MPVSIRRFTVALVIGGALALPAAALAAEPASAPPPAVVAWQAHLDHMRAMGPNLGSHVRECVAMHGSMAGLFGPNGAMIGMMADTTAR